MKITAADPKLLRHEGHAIVFEDVHDLAARVDDEGCDLDFLRGRSKVVADAVTYL